MCVETNKVSVGGLGDSVSLLKIRKKVSIQLYLKMQFTICRRVHETVFFSSEKYCLVLLMLNLCNKFYLTSVTDGKTDRYSS